MGSITMPARRQFLKTSAIAGGGLMLSLYLPVRDRMAQAGARAGDADEAHFAPNAFIRITADNWVTLMVDKSEMGQGVMTSLPMLLADEMDADWTRVHIEQAPAAPAYVNPMLGMQATGGSTSVRSSWLALRQAGAVARALLLEAASAQWNVDRGICHARLGVIYGPAGQQASFGSVAAAAAKLPVPADAKLKDPKDFTLIGKPVARVDVPSKTNGTAVFGIDVQVPGMLIASVVQCPTFGGKLAAVDDHAALKVPGVQAVVPISSGVAVVATDFWSAKKGRDALKIQWDRGPDAAMNDASILAMFREGSKEPGAVAWQVGQGDAALQQKPGWTMLEATYTVPFLAHATMEPMNCTAHVQKDRCDIWGPTQAQTFNQITASKITGLEQSAIYVHTTFLGGGFGRRFEQDFVAQAVEISKAVSRPVKV
ncbi:MAG: xanthine dehydrogenase family protein molybdopterin-binding subunit, partial [Betaproteobacteria bacterium]|nr:xanthine dehydrogenase family protein molybdopterin-binding subunit [Betaproteobacteria bacterium]